MAGHNTKKIRVIVSIILLLVIFGALAWLFLYLKAGHDSEKTAEEMREKYVHESNDEKSFAIPYDRAGLVDMIKELAKKDVDIEGLQKINPDVMGWISVSGISEIDYPLLHTDNDSFYLEHDIYKDKNIFGAIFLETANHTDFSDLHEIIYGHDTKNGSMFGGLKNYTEKSFYEENGGFIAIYLPDRTDIYQIFSVESVEPDDQAVYSLGFDKGQAWSDYINDMKSRSLYDTGVPVDENSQVITLSTCDHHTKRLTIHGVRIISFDRG